MTDPASKARDLMAAIRYQVFRPEVTTMGACANGCRSSARGSATCAECLGYEIDDMLGTPAGSAYVEACKEQRWAERRVLAALGGGET